MVRKGAYATVGQIYICEKGSYMLRGGYTPHDKQNLYYGIGQIRDIKIFI